MNKILYFCVLLNCNAAFAAPVAENYCEVSTFPLEKDFDQKKFLGEWQIFHDHKHIGKWDAEHIFLTQDAENNIIAAFGNLNSDPSVTGRLVQLALPGDYEFHEATDSHTARFRIIFTDYSNVALVYEKLLSNTENVGIVGASDAYILTRGQELSQEQQDRLNTLIEDLCLNDHGVKTNSQDSADGNNCDISIFPLEKDFDQKKFLGKWQIVHDHKYIGKWDAEHIFLTQDAENNIIAAFGNLNSDPLVTGRLVQLALPGDYEFHEATDSHTARFRIIFTDYSNVALVYEKLLSNTENVGIVGASDAYILTRGQELSQEQQDSLSYLIEDLCLNDHVVKSNHHDSSDGDFQKLGIGKVQESGDVQVQELGSGKVQDSGDGKVQGSGDESVEAKLTNVPVEPMEQNSGDAEMSSGDVGIITSGDEKSTLGNNLDGSGDTDSHLDRSGEVESSGEFISVTEGSGDDGRHIELQPIAAEDSGELPETEGSGELVYTEGSGEPGSKSVIKPEEDGSGDVTCPTTLVCHDGPCLHGSQKDEHGCDSCECLRPKVPIMSCGLLYCKNGAPISCKNGVWKNKHGCLTCDCKPEDDKVVVIEETNIVVKETESFETSTPETCPDNVLCTLECEFGFKVDENHCNMCECLPQTCANERAAILNRINNALNVGTPLLGAEPPQCDENGLYMGKQCRGSSCFCVDFEGDAISPFSINRWEPEVEVMNCKCAREHHGQKQLGIQVPTVSCDFNGNYTPIQCVKDVCYCVDESGAQAGLEVPKNNLETLGCDKEEPIAVIETLVESP